MRNSQHDPMGHRQIEHTADLALELWAPTLEALFLEGARAVLCVLTEDKPVEHTHRRTVQLQGASLEECLVAWLNEVIYWGVCEGWLFGAGMIDILEVGNGLDQFEVRGSVEGEADAAPKVAAELKSVTYHELRIEGSAAAGFRTTVVIDV